MTDNLKKTDGRTDGRTERPTDILTQTDSKCLFKNKIKIIWFGIEMNALSQRNTEKPLFFPYQQKKHPLEIINDFCPKPNKIF